MKRVPFSGDPEGCTRPVGKRVERFTSTVALPAGRSTALWGAAKLFLAVAGLNLFMAAVATACPLCRESVAVDHASEAGVFNDSVICMLGGLFAIAGIVITKIITVIRTCSN